MNDQEFQKISSGQYVKFKTGLAEHVYITVQDVDTGQLLVSNFSVDRDHSVIIDRNGQLKNTKYGKIWQDIQGNYHKY